jgi:hypothetical protein
MTAQSAHQIAKTPAADQERRIGKKVLRATADGKGRDEQVLPHQIHLHHHHRLRVEKQLF